jgi:DNA-binding MarR family transcriptional regulator
MRFFSTTTRHLIAIHRETKRLWAAHAAAAGLTPNQLRVLYRVWEHGRCPMSTLVQHLGVTTGAVTGMADKLEQEGLVARVPSPEDRRVCFLEVPAAAKERVDGIWQAWEQRLASWVQRVPTGEREALERALAALAAAAAEEEAHDGA